MCASTSTGSGGGGAIAGAIIGGCLVICCIGVAYKMFCKKAEVAVEEEVEIPPKTEEVMVNPGSTIESQTVTQTSSTQMVQSMGPPAAGLFMPPPPPMMGQPMGMMQPGMGQQMQ